MATRRNMSQVYLSLVLFLVFLLTFFNIFLEFRDLIFDFFRSYARFPLTEILIHGDFLLLLGLLFFVYRGWKEEIGRRRVNEGSLLSLQKAVETMQIGVTIADPKGKILYVNQAEAGMHGYLVEELTGKDARLFGPAERWKAPTQPILKRFRRDSVNVRKDGSTFPVQLMSDVVTGADGEIIAVITTCEDITERKKNEETIRQLAFYDALTGLPNRSLFNDRLSQELAKARRHREFLAIVFVDLDRFKVVNDTLGHATGDLLLQAVSQRLKKIIREGDTVTRLGGDEFIMLFPDVTRREGVSAIAEKILARMSEAYVLNETEVYITASVGISLFPDDGEEIEALVKNADTALYYAKELGRNNYQFYSATINDNALERLSIQGHLRRAIKENDFVVHYQPLVDLRNGKIVGAEALLRLRHDDGLLSPKKFIPVAEESGLISVIGESLLFTTCAQNKAWQQAGFPPIRMAVNISIYQFNQEGFVRMLRGVLAEIGLAPEYLELEFTESIVMQNSESAVSKLKELRSLGVHCAIDDFGTGYSSLSYLKYLPISKLKLDQSFVHSLTLSPNDNSISEAIISMAHSLHLRVTAEGVETVPQLEFLRSRDCDEAQGFLFSRPLPAKEFTNLLAGYEENNRDFTLFDRGGIS